MSDLGHETDGEGTEVPSPEAIVEPSEAEPAEVAEEAAAEAEAEPAAEPETDWEALVAERTADLQRLQAEYVNYKKRVDRDRSLARQAGIESVIAELMPVLDSIELARTHADLEGGFKLVADELAKVAAKHELVSFGQVGDEFDPNCHEALMELPLAEAVSVATVSQVMQPGYRLAGRVIRPARVAVANP